MTEAEVQRDVLLELSSRGFRLFRNNVGVARYRTADGREQRVVYGLCPGSSDLIGWQSITIKPEHVGQRLAVFCALEVKSDEGRASPRQSRFLRAVIGAGGVAGVVRSVRDALDLVRGVAP